MDVSKQEAATTHEVLNHTLQAQVITEDLDQLRSEIEPNLPWADDHFLERVGGKPLNPPPSHEHWPFATRSNEKFTEPRALEIDERDWAYLAGMIDGDGCISIPDNRARIFISQKDKEYLEWLHRKFSPLGNLHDKADRHFQTNEHEWVASGSVWVVSRRDAVEFVLEHVIPHLRQKRKRAEEALEVSRARVDSPKARWKPFVVEGDPQFSHTYPERLWPKHAAGADTPRRGIRYEYGDLGDVVQHLAKSPLSRQAYIPLWSLEDTGKLDVRVPCTLGYHVIYRHGFLHLTYYIRSCDVAHHMRDDIYLAVRLQLWILERLRELESTVDWKDVKPGLFTMHVVSLHMFINDYNQHFRRRAP